MAAFFVALVVSIVLNVIAYLITPKPKPPKAEASQGLESPTADASRPLPVPFGTVTIKAPNVLWFGRKYVRTYKVRA